MSKRSKSRRAYARTKKRLQSGSHKLEFQDSTGQWITRNMGKQSDMMVDMIVWKIKRPNLQWRVRPVGMGKSLTCDELAKAFGKEAA